MGNAIQASPNGMILNSRALFINIKKIWKMLVWYISSSWSNLSSVTLEPKQSRGSSTLNIITSQNETPNPTAVTTTKCNTP